MSYAGMFFFNGMVSFIRMELFQNQKLLLFRQFKDWKTFPIHPGNYQQNLAALMPEDSLTLKQQLLQKGMNKIDFWLNRVSINSQSNSQHYSVVKRELKKTKSSGYLLSAPDILILDNAFTGLDINSRKTLHLVLNRLAATGTTIILIALMRMELPCCITHFITLEEGSMRGVYSYRVVWKYISAGKYNWRKQPSWKKTDFGVQLFKWKAWILNMVKSKSQ